MAELFERLMNDLADNNTASPIFTHHINFLETKVHYERAVEYTKTEPSQIVADYIASMTDDYFVDLYRYLFPESKREIPYKGYFE